MKIALNIVGVVLLIPGIGWFLQGINVLPGSFMSGDPKWAIIGVILIVVAAALLLFANLRKGGTKKAG